MQGSTAGLWVDRCVLFHSISTSETAWQPPPETFAFEN